MPDDPDAIGPDAIGPEAIGPEAIGPDEEDPTLGEPVTELRDVTFGVGDQFATRVRGRIERRVLTGEVVELLWTAPLTMMLEFLRWPFELFRTGRR